MKLQADWPCRSVSLRIHRNQGVEQTASALAPFLAYAGLRAALEVGDYDDALSFPPRAAVDAELVWLDFERYALEEEPLTAWLLQRLQALRAAGAGALVVANAPGRPALNAALAAWAEATPSAAILDLAAITDVLGEAGWDRRRAALTACPLSDQACLLSARTLGCQLLPGLLGTALKVVAVDLDHTLYAGVLGEDGIEGLDLTPGHKALQELLVDLVGRGLLLVVVSRNEPDDVRALFDRRTDFPLRPQHVVDWQVSWGGKAEAIDRAVAGLRVGLDSALMVDDNLGELTAIAQALPAVSLVYAGSGPEQTAAVLRGTPGLWLRGGSDADTVRRADLQANRQRQDLAQAATNPLDYLRSLEVELTFSLDPGGQRPRLAEICRKTNQFNLSLRRFTDVEVAAALADPERRVAMVWMKDRLADSGSVAAIFARRQDGLLVIEELCVSCRAMGRAVEDVMILEAVTAIQEDLPSPVLRFVHAVGPRNRPARRWLEDLTGQSLGDAPGSVDFAWSSARMADLRARMPVRLHWAHRSLS